MLVLVIGAGAALAGARFDLPLAAVALAAAALGAVLPTYVDERLRRRRPSWPAVKPRGHDAQRPRSARSSARS
ncbi:MAG: hypothetical protein Q8O56_14615 [Solirubrobacteraceae bacterium]|nr:hypothetical protein [Solirubrobacteraceae bacterium]